MDNQKSISQRGRQYEYFQQGKHCHQNGGHKYRASHQFARTKIRLLNIHHFEGAAQPVEGQSQGMNCHLFGQDRGCVQASIYHLTLILQWIGYSKHIIHPPVEDMVVDFSFMEFIFALSNHPPCHAFEGGWLAVQCRFGYSSGLSNLLQTESCFTGVCCRII